MPDYYQAIRVLVRDGKTNLEIAQLLGYSVGGVKRRISQMLKQYKAKRRGQL